MGNTTTKRTIAGNTVIRESPGHPAGQWWVMNRRDTGFASFGYPFPSLSAALDAYAVRVVGAGVDKFGVYVEIAPL